MKYSNSNPPLVCMMTQSTCYQSTRPMKPVGFLIHSTGANNTSISRYVQPSDDDANKQKLLNIIGTNRYGNDWNHIYYEAGVNAFIGELANGSVSSVQTLPWEYRPWGCGSGPKGSCNDGWIQCEICEDNLKNKAYFEKVYAEAVELVAYACKLYEINPLGTVVLNGVTVPTILCHKDSNSLGLGSAHGDVLHWFPKHGKTMEDFRNDVNKLINEPEKPAEPEVKEIYRIRKNWNDAGSQIGAFNSLEKAKAACDTAGPGYYVFNSAGIAIYPENNAVVATQQELKVGNTIKLIPNAEYVNGKAVPKYIYGYTLYVRKILDNGDIVFSTQKTGAITGIISPNQAQRVASTVSSGTQAVFDPYQVRINTAVLNVRAGAGTNYRITAQLTLGEVHTITEQKGNWGKIKKANLGWICLDYTQKL